MRIEADPSVRHPVQPARYRAIGSERNTMNTTAKYKPADLLADYLRAKNKCEFEHAMDKIEGRTSVRTHEF